MATRTRDIAARNADTVDGLDSSQIGAKGSAGNVVFWENDTSVTANYTISSGKNSMTAGPVVIADGVTVTVPDGTTWTIV